jgi:hypothetical protein
MRSRHGYVLGRDIERFGQPNKQYRNQRKNHSKQYQIERPEVHGNHDALYKILSFL